MPDHDPVNLPFADISAVGEHFARGVARHPRLIVTEADLAAVQAQAVAEPRIAAVLDETVSRADGLMAVAPVQRVVEGRRLLQVSREAMGRVAILSLAHRLRGSSKYLERALIELRAISEFEDYNPTCFLDVAEMVSALALGYDWLHASLSEVDRAMIRRAIVEKGIAPSFEPPYAFWHRWTNNWNAVCHGGLSLGALAVADEDHDLAVQVIARMLACAPEGLGVYAPDGAYPEGPSYWVYGTSYLMMTIAALRASVACDFGLSEGPGVMASGDYYLHVSGPTGMPFTYGDSRASSDGAIDGAQLYLATLRQQPWLAWGERLKADRLLGQNASLLGPTPTSARFLPLTIRGMTGGICDAAPPATHYLGRGETPVALHRTSWDRDATFVGIKGGWARTNHSHLDAGTFVVDALGVRWVCDLGMQDYHSLESRGIDIWDLGQESPRWDVFRMGPFSHSILTVDGRRPNVAGRAEFISSTGGATRLDLTEVYRGQLGHVERSVEIDATGAVIVEDAIEGMTGGVSAAVRWAFVTTADTTQNAEGSIQLRANGRLMDVRVDEPVGIAMTILQRDPQPRDHDAPNAGVSIVGFTIKIAPAERVVLRTVFRPRSDAASLGDASCHIESTYDKALEPQ